MKVNTITSMHTQLPLDYYSMPFCEPDGGPKKASENLGEFITGNKIQSSPYHLYMLLENFCSVLCQKTLTAAQAKTLKKGEVDCVEWGGQDSSALGGCYIFLLLVPLILLFLSWPSANLFFRRSSPPQPLSTSITTTGSLTTCPVPWWSTTRI